MKKFIIEPEYDRYKISEYLTSVKGYSSRSMRNLEIFMNGKRVKTSKKIRKLNRLLVKEKIKGTNIKPIAMNLDIVYEDDNLLIINKSANIVVHPTLKKVDETLANGIVHHMKELTGTIAAPRFYNRLDMNTTGIIVATKNAYTQAFLQDKEKATIKKCYKAVVSGIIAEDDFFVETPIGRVGDALRRETVSIEDGGQSAKTHIKVIGRNEEKNISLIEVELFTGRTHQIRVHTSTIGHPIVGDQLYDGDMDLANRQLLHSYKFEFTNPDTNKQVIVEAPLPDDMSSFFGKESDTNAK